MALWYLISSIYVNINKVLNMNYGVLSQDQEKHNNFSVILFSKTARKPLLLSFWVGVLLLQFNTAQAQIFPAVGTAGDAYGVTDATVDITLNLASGTTYVAQTNEMCVEGDGANGGLGSDPEWRVNVDVSAIVSSLPICNDVQFRVCRRGDFGQVSERVFVYDELGNEIGVIDGAPQNSTAFDCTADPICTIVSFSPCAFNDQAADGVMQFGFYTNGILGGNSVGDFCFLPAGPQSDGDAGACTADPFCPMFTQSVGGDFNNQAAGGPMVDAQCRGCNCLFIDYLIIDVSEATPEFTFSDDEICVGESVEMNWIPNNCFQSWTVNGTTTPLGGSSATFAPTTAGTFTICNNVGNENCPVTECMDFVVHGPAEITTPADVGPICVGEDASFTADATSGTPPFMYQWELSTDGGTNWGPTSDGATFTGSLTNTLSVFGAPLIFDGNQFRLTAIDANGCMGNSDPATLSVMGCDPSLDMTKSATGPTSALGNNGTSTDGGDQIMYTYDVCNDGQVTVTNLMINDPGPTFGGQAGSGVMGMITCATTTLQVNECTTCMATYTLSQNDVNNSAGGTADNTATAGGDDPFGNPYVSDPSSATVPVPLDPMLTMDKSGSMPSISSGSNGSIVDEGDVITYTYVVENTGNVTIDNVTIVDAGPTFNGVPGTNSLSPINCGTSSLDPGQSTTCTATYVLSQADINNGLASNTANATGMDPTGATVDSPDDTATTDISAMPMLEMDKTAGSPSILNGVDGLITDAGDEVEYIYEVCNTGNVTLSNVAPMDSGPSFGGVAGTNSLSSFMPVNVAALDPGDCAMFTATYILSQDDVNNSAGIPGAIMNTANAVGTDPSGGTVAAPDDTAQTDITNAPMLAMEKSAAAPTIAAGSNPSTVDAGDEIIYTYEVENTGNVTIDNVSISDPGPSFGGVQGTNALGAITCVATSLAPGATTICMATYTLSQTDVNNGAGIPGGVENTAMASGTDPSGAGVDSPEDTAETQIPSDPSLAMDKSAAAPTIVNGAEATTVDAGDEILYTYVVTNDGNVTMDNITINDNGPTFNGATGTNSLSAIVCIATTLMPGDMTTCTATYILSQTDLDNAAGVTSGVANTANAAGTDPSGAPVDSPDDTATTEIPAMPSLAFDKSAGMPSTSSGANSTFVDAGDEIIYTYTVTNDGNVSMSNITVNDSGPSFNGTPGTNVLSPITCIPTTLAPGESATCTATYILSQADLDNGASMPNSVTNTANASGTDPTGTVTDSPDDTAVTDIPSMPMLAMDKTASEPTILSGSNGLVTDAGDEIEYTYEVCNTGNVTISNVAPMDGGPSFGGVAGTSSLSAFSPVNVAILNPGDCATFTAIYVLSQDDVNNSAGIPGAIMNTANAVGTDPSGAAVTAPDDTAQTDIANAPMLTMEKSAADPTIVNGTNATIVDAGDEIIYSYEVENTGNVSIDNIIISDPGPSFGGSPGTNTLSTIVCMATSLVPGATTTCTATYILSQVDIDNGAGIAGGVTNTAMASGTDPTGAGVDSPEDMAETQIPNNPSLAMDKSAAAPTVANGMDASFVDAGDEIVYSYVVMNDGNVTMNNVTVNDSGPTFNGANGTNSLSAIVCLATTLMPGETTTCIATYILSQADIDNGAGVANGVSNTANASGTDPSGTPVDSPDDTAVTEIPSMPSLAFDKSAGMPSTSSGANSSIVDAGDQITYTYVVTNDGNVSISNITVNDPGPSFNGVPGANSLSPITCAPTTLEPGETATCTATYTLSQTDIDNGATLPNSVSNTANATGMDPSGSPIDSPDDTAITDIPSMPMLAMDKGAAEPTILNGVNGLITDAGDEIEYTYEVCNTGNVSLSNVAPMDNGPSFGGAAGTNSLSAFDPVNVAILDPGDCAVFTAIYVLSQVDVNNSAGIPGAIVNTANASGTDPSGGTVTAPDDTAQTDIANAPMLAMEKSAGEPSVVNGANGGIVDAGDEIVYTYEVENTGNVSLDNIVISDPGPSFGGISGTNTLSTIVCIVTSLAPTETTICTATYILSQIDINNGAGIPAGVTNTAMASGTDPSGAGVDSPEDMAETQLPAIPSLAMEKSAAAPTIANGAEASFVDAGDEILYTYVVTNDGNVTMDNISINDPGPTFNGANGTNSLSPIVCMVTTLEPGEATTCTATYILSQTDVDNAAGVIDGVANTANALGTDPSGISHDSPDDMAMTEIPAMPSLAFDKSAGAPSISAGANGNIVDAGDEILYSYTVTNDGNVTISNVSVNDPGPTFNGVPGTNSLSPIICLPTTLTPGEVATCTATYTLSQTDIDNGATLPNSVANTANASGLDPSGATVDSPDDSAITHIPATPMLSMDKSAAEPTVLKGSDGLLTDAGDEILYTYEVCNTGNVSLTGVVPNDPGPSFNGLMGANSLGAYDPASSDLAPGDCTTFSAIYVLAQEDVDNGAGIPGGITNTADASGIDPSGSTVTSPEDTAVTELPSNPMLEMDKRASELVDNGNGIVDAGDIIPYEYDVINTGNVTIDNVMIVDQGPSFNGIAGTGTMSPIVCLPTTLAPGETVTCTATYTLSDVDVANGAGIPGGVSNTANAEGTDPQGNTVESPEDTEVIQFPCEADATWTAPEAPICDNDDPRTLVLDNLNLPIPPAVVSWTGLGITDNNDGTASFDGSDLAGNIELCATVYYNDLCQDTKCHTIEVIVAPTLPPSVTLDFTCQFDAVGSISLSQYFPGIDVSNTEEWALSGGGLANVVGGAVVYDEPGCYDLTLTYVGPCVVTPSEVTSYAVVSEQPQPSFQIQDQVCWSDGDPLSNHIYVALTNSPSYKGAVTTAYSVTGPATLNDEVNGEISVTGTGTVVLCLTETIAYEACGSLPAGTCTEQFCVDIEVQDGTAQDASFTVDNEEPCIGQTVTYTANLPGGQFSGPGVVDHGNGLTGSLVVTECGEFLINYTLNTTNGCTSQSTYLQQTDLTAPIISVAASDEIVECDGNGNINQLNAWLSANGNAVAEDNCTFSWSWDLLNVISGCGSTQTTVYRFTATDECGNVSTTQANFIIEDTTDPVIVQGSDMAMNECDNDPGGNFPEFDAWLESNAGATASDVCGSVTWTNDYSPTNFVETCPGTRSVDVVFTATDDCGNTSSVTHTWAVGDNTPPEFTNCERLPIVIGAPETWCEAFVNFSPLAASDNCTSDVIVSQIDNSGLNSGGLFPVGTTELTFLAVDACGNSTECSFKVIVNDFHTAPEFTSCPEDQSALCGEDLPSDLAIEFEDNCPDNSAVIWKAEDPSGSVVASGMDVLESTTQFTVGDHNVSFRVQDQPLLLITEVVQAGTDMIEISNLGPATLDLNCLTINRYGNGVESDTLPAGTTLEPGAVMVYTFASDIGYLEAAAYTLEYMNATFDQLAVNGYSISDWTGNLNGGDVCRVWNWDHNSSNDWKVTLNCTQNIGVLNNTLDFMANNSTSTSLQSEVASVSECSFVLSVEDDQAPTCAAIVQEASEKGENLTIDPGTCNESTVIISELFTVDYVQINGLSITHPDMSQVSIYLIAPDGTQTKVLDGQCNGTANFLSSISDTSQVDLVSADCNDFNSSLWFAPVESFNRFSGMNSAGTWTLNVMGAGVETGALNNWELQLFEFGPYSGINQQMEVTQQAGTEHTWTHPLIDDNCCTGSVTLNMINPDGTGTSQQVVGGSTMTNYFLVGCTQVNYTLTDCGGNKTTCGDFEVCITDNFIPASCCDDEFICISELNVSLGQNCEAEFRPEMGGVGLMCVSSFYDVEILDENGNIIRNADGTPLTVLNADHIGRSLSYRISNNDPMCDNQNSCWGNINVEYKLVPQIVCPDTMITTCAVLEVMCLPDLLNVEDNCAGNSFEVFLADEQRETIECGDPRADDYTHIITRTYRSRDNNGNLAGFCEQMIFLERVESADITYPSWATINCSDLGNFELTADGCPAPWLAMPELDLEIGLPFTGMGTTGSGTGSGTIAPNICVTGMDQDPDNQIVPLFPGTGSTCNGFVTFTDVLLPDVGCSKKFIRTWEIFEWNCGVEELMSGVPQVIEVIDDQAPVIDVCPPDFEVTTNDNCAGDIELPLPQATDACDNGINVTIQHPFGLVEVQDGVTPTATLETGKHRLEYTVSDDCYNINTECIAFVTVRDNTQPIAICEQTTVVSISQDGNTIVSSDVFDDGSWDECGPVTTCATKMEDLVLFRSLSVDTTLNGTDYVLKSRVDNGCLQQYVAGIELDGIEYLSEADLCVPYVRFCCTNVGVDQMVVFRAIDGGGNTSDCMVNVEVQDKSIPNLTCPDDVTIDCRVPFDLNFLGFQFGNYTIDDNCGDTQQVDTLITPNLNQCGQGSITREFSISSFGLVVMSCKQEITIINEAPFTVNDIVWPLDFDAACGTASTLTPEAIALNPDLGENFARPSFSNSDNCSLLGYDFEDEFFASDPISQECGVINRIWTAIDWCTQRNGTFATFQFTQTIKIEDNIAPVLDAVSDTTIMSSNASCTSVELSLSRTVGPDCTPFSSLNWNNQLMDATGTSIFNDVDGNPIDLRSSSITATLAAGTYSIVWSVSDGCGNTTTDMQNLTILNTKLPIPICRNGIAVSLDSHGEVELWASDIDGGSYHPCGPQLGITLSFNAAGTQSNMLLSCDPNETYPVVMPVSLYVIDNQTGLGDFCVGTVEVQDPTGACSTSQKVTLSGDIKTETQQSIEEVKVELTSTTFDMTDGNGNYAFADMPIGGDYNVAPVKNDDHMNGVSTLDLIIIQRHILGIETLDSPYQLLAADVNSSEGVNGIDLVELRKLILGIYTEFPDNTSWRFVDAEYQFADAHNPWLTQIAETYDIVGLSSDMDIDFVGVKVGDVNGDIAFNAQDQAVDTRSQGAPLVMEYDAVRVSKGEEVIVPFYFRNYEQVSGWQTTMEWDKDLLEVMDLIDKTPSNPVSYNLGNGDKGILTMSQAGTSAEDKSSDEVIFELRFKAKEDVDLSTAFILSSSVTTAEAYRGYSDKVELRLDTRVSEESQIISVTPNPWITMTEVNFYIAQQGKGIWEFYDVNGRMLHRATDQYATGYHTMRLSRNQIDGTGVIYAKLTTDQGVAEYKMILVD